MHNCRLADQLNGKLLLAHGTNDRFVPFSHTLRMVAALKEADKPYDLLARPGGGHGEMESPQEHRYLLDAYRRYFASHLKP